ncbi:MAG: hypothetical protein ACP5XB_20050, partial [Isosphaeraceae bacterium]
MTRKDSNLLWIQFVLSMIVCSFPVCSLRAGDGRTFYVSSSTGHDKADGTSEAAAWKELDRVNAAELRPGDTVLFRRGDTWRGQLRPRSGSAGKPVTYGAYGNGARPLLLGSVSRDRPGDWHDEGRHIWATERANELGIDVGNIIFDHGQSVGVKKWKREDLKQPGDYWYSGADWQVRLYSERNPAEVHRSIELALRRHIVDQAGAHHLVHDGLALACGAAHGFGGGPTRYLVIRDCDVSWIGGGHQFTQPNGNPVRFGNGIEFWENARDILVEGCRIWEIYDAALTNQGSREDSQINITYRDNVIWNS